MLCSFLQDSTCWHLLLVHTAHDGCALGTRRRASYSSGHLQADVRANSCGVRTTAKQSSDNLERLKCTSGGGRAIASPVVGIIGWGLMVNGTRLDSGKGVVLGTELVWGKEVMSCTEVLSGAIAQAHLA